MNIFEGKPKRKRIGSQQNWQNMKPPGRSSNSADPPL